MDWYRVIKKIHGHRYYYYQKTYRVGRQVKTLNKYVGPVDKVPRPAARLASSPKGSVNAGMKNKKETQGHMQRFGDPLDLHENHTFSNTCPVCMNAHEHASSVNATMTPNKDSDLESGAQLYGCIPELNKMPPELRDALYRVVQLAIKQPQYETFAAHLLHPTSGLFSSFGQLLTFSRKLTSQENINGDHAAELFKVLHLNASELQPEFSSSGAPTVNAPMKLNRQNACAADELANLSGFSAEQWYAYAEEKKIALLPYLKYINSLEYPERDHFVNRLVDVITGYSDASLPPLPMDEEMLRTTPRLQGN